jgi:hypothetical protein
MRAILCEIAELVIDDQDQHAQAPAAPRGKTIARRYLIVVSLSEMRELAARDENANTNRLRLRLAMNRGSSRFGGLSRESAPWPWIQ